MEKGGMEIHVQYTYRDWDMSVYSCLMSVYNYLIIMVEAISPAASLCVP